MALNDLEWPFCVKKSAWARQPMGWRLRVSGKTVRKFAELPIYCQRQKYSPENVVSGSIRFMQIFAGVPWRGGVKWECGRWKWRFLLLSFTVFRTFYIYGHWPHDSFHVWYDCRYFRVIKLFHIKFLENGALHGKSYCRVLIGNHTLAFDWWHFWWPWSTFEGHFRLGCHFYVHFSNLWQAFASRGLPAIAELLVWTCIHLFIKFLCDTIGPFKMKIFRLARTIDVSHLDDHVDCHQAVSFGSPVYTNSFCVIHLQWHTANSSDE